MYEHMTYENILQRMLSRVGNHIDKREGSVIYDALAPAAAELAQMYIEMDINYNLSFADTASGEYLTRKAEEFGVIRNKATPAVRKGSFYNGTASLMDIPIGSRFSIEGQTFAAIERVSTGIYKLQCESVGQIGNKQFGSMLPIDFIANLASAELGDVLVPGEDEEDDESLRKRLFETVNEPAFGGNVSDYKQRISAISGVGATKVYPVWNGGGTVKCTIISSDWSVPSTALVDQVQQIIDPKGSSGEGIGQAPIGHTVSILGVSAESINITTRLTLSSGLDPAQVQIEVEEAINDYLLELRKDWANQQNIVVRTAQIDARLLTVPGVEDVMDTQINGVHANVTLEADEIPLLGAVIING